MLKTKKKKNRNSLHFVGGLYERPLKELTNMKHRDVQRACIIRGLEFANVAKFDHWKLVEWFCHNFENAQDEKLLLEYDIFVEEELKTRGYKKGDILMSPALRFSYNGPGLEKMDKVVIIKPNVKVEKTTEKKPKAQIDEKTGVRAGTKKAMTYELAGKGIELGEIKKQVKLAFPEAQDKSIQIWYKRALKASK